MIRRELLEDEANTERWMVSYADFITLLFGFFVVMYAISSVNNDKYRVLSATLAEAFDVEVLSQQPIQIGEPTLSASPHVIDLPDATAFADQTEGDTWVRDNIDQAKSMLGGFADEEGISVRANTDWLELSVDAGLLFAAGSASLSPASRAVLENTAQLLRENDNPITIEGYTDNVVATASRFASNWELSAARASAVASFFVDAGIRQKRLAAVGYGENHPVATNATPDGRRQNRRVVIVVARHTDASRNLNANPNTAAFAFVEQADPLTMDPGVVQQRTEEGGLLFTNEAPEPVPGPGDGDAR
jgi:chemotaxis protein MotB